MLGLESDTIDTKHRARTTTTIGLDVLLEVEKTMMQKERAREMALTGRRVPLFFRVLSLMKGDFITNKQFHCVESSLTRRFATFAQSSLSPRPPRNGAAEAFTARDPGEVNNTMLLRFPKHLLRRQNVLRLCLSLCNFYLCVIYAFVPPHFHAPKRAGRRLGSRLFSQQQVCVVVEARMRRVFAVCTTERRRLDLSISGLL